MRKRYVAALSALGLAVAGAVPLLAGTAEASEGQAERYIVSFDGNAVSRALSAVGLSAVRELATGDAVVNATKSQLAKLQAVPGVTVEKDAWMTAQSVPNDPLYAQQWDLSEPTGGINAPGAWNVASGQGVTVAVIDTGITPHSDLNANVLPGYD